MAESISSSISTDYLSMLQSAATTATNSNSSSETQTSSSKSTQDIISELRQTGSYSNMSAQDIADEYGVSLSKAEEILQELKSDADPSGYTMDNPIPEGSTVSYHV